MYLITIVNGDILTGDCSVIAHQTNCFGVPSTDFERRLYNMYPSLQMANRGCVYTPRGRLGKYTFIEEGDKTLFNLYGQQGFGNSGRYTDYGALENSLVGMLRELGARSRMTDTTKIGLPYDIGCGLSGGDESEVMRVIERCFSDGHVYLYKQRD